MKRIFLLQFSVFIVLVAVYVHFSVNSPSVAVAQQPLIWNMPMLQQVKQSKTHKDFIQTKILKVADYYISQPMLSVMSKKKSIVPNKHNYQSLSIYMWPDSANPDAPYLYKDGVMNPDLKNYDGDNIGKFMERLVLYSIAYYITDSLKYKQAYNKQLRTWFLDADTYMYPNFDYAQFAPGWWDGKGAFGGIIDAYVFIDVIESIELMNLLNCIDDETYQAVREWFSDFKDWLLTSDNGKKESNVADNHSIAYMALLSRMAYFTGDIMLANTIQQKMSRLIFRQIDKNGQQPLELQRTCAWFYSIYNLQHIMDYCIMANSMGAKFYDRNKQRIDAAFDYLIHFIGKPNDFPYQELRDWGECEQLLQAEILRLSRLNHKIYNTPSNRFESVFTLIK
ncbi:MAG: alginate lyase family protein [Prevotellaceae bacterium]|nr:alginate lyase family protein [Prevotellaceae bacterium]